MRRKKANDYFIAVKTQHVKVNFLILPTAKSILGYEKVFIALRDKTEDEESRYYYDRCRAILKWASTCGGELDNIDFTDNNVIFYIKFMDFNSLTDFQKDYDQSVSDATIS